MRILVTGATGFIGQYFVQRYAEVYELVCIARNLPDAQDVPKSIEWVGADLSDFDSVLLLADHIGKIDAIVHIGGASPNRAYADGNYDATIVGTRAIVELAKMIGNPRIVYLSSICVEFDYSGPYKHSKLVAERIIKESRLDYYIIRPETVVGPGAKDFERTINAGAKYSFLPLIGTGRNSVQPVYVGDLCKQIIEAVQGNHSVKTLRSVGPTNLPLRKFLARAVLKKGKNLHILPIPKIIVRVAAFFTERIVPKLGLNQERISIITASRRYVRDKQTTSIDGMLSYLSK